LFPARDNEHEFSQKERIRSSLDTPLPNGSQYYPIFPP
jgi:hypothetical protein